MRTQETSERPFGESLLILFGFAVGLSIILTTISTIFGEKIPASALTRYKNCVALQQDLGDGIIKADGKCDYLKRQ